MEWKSAKLGELANINYGYTAKASFEINGPKFLRITDIQNGSVNWSTVPSCEISGKDFAKHMLEADDIVFARTGATTGKSYLIKAVEKSVAASYLIRLRLKSDIVLPEFIHLFFQTAEYWSLVEAGSSGSAQGGFNASKLSNLEINFPPLQEQKRIVAQLDTVFADLEQTRIKTEQNLKNARELFDSYLQQVLSQKGEGWVEKEIGEVANLSRGQNPPKSEFISEPREGYVRFYQIRDGKTDKFAVYVPENSKLHYVNETDILMVAYRHVGNAFRGVKGAFNVALCKIVNKNKEVLHDDFLFYLIPSSFIKGELLKVSERSLIPSMSVKHLAQLKIPIPPPHKQDEIVRKINLMEEECKRLEFLYNNKIESLDELKKSILQKAFNGELTTTTK